MRFKQEIVRFVNWLRANQIARITSDFKMDVIKLNILGQKNFAYRKVNYREAQQNKHTII